MNIEYRISNRRMLKETKLRQLIDHLGDYKVRVFRLVGSLFEPNSTLADLQHSIFLVRHSIFISCCAVVLVLPTTPAFAAGRSLTLNEAVTLALTRNQEIVKAKEYGANAQGRYVEERSAALPQISFESGLAKGRDETVGTPSQDKNWLGLSLIQPVYTWGKIGAAVRAAEKGLLTAQDRLAEAQQKTRLKVTEAFYSILLAKELHSLAQENLNQKTRHLEEARRKFEAGVATDYDVLAAQVAVDNARPEVIRSQNQIVSSQDQLRFLLSLAEDVDAEGRLDVTISPVQNYDSAHSAAINSRPELADLRHRIGMYEEIAVLARTGLKPRLDLKVGAEWKDLDQTDGTAYSAGLVFSWPLFDGQRTNGKVAQAESDVRSLKADEQKILDAIAQETREAVNQVREAEEILSALSSTIVQAERLLKMAETGFELGVKIRLEVEDAEFNLRQAKSNLARARRDYLVAITRLAWATGSLREP